MLVTDFGDGTTDFSVWRIAQSDAARKCKPLASTGIGIAGDRLDRRVVERLVLPMLGKGGRYRSMGKVLDVPGGLFAEWSRLALMRNRGTLDDLCRLQRDALDPEPIGCMIVLIEREQGFPLYDAVGRLKRAPPDNPQAEFRFESGQVEIAAEVDRCDFEAWIAPVLLRIEAALDDALAKAALAPGAIDRVFLKGGSSLIPAIRAIFDRRFGTERIATGGELTSIAHGLGLIGQEANVAA